MEYATGMLLAESAVENYGSLVERISRSRSTAMLARLDARAGERGRFPRPPAPLLDEMFRRAQERVLLAQVAREIQANLRHMEQVLDAFFRDHAKRAELATLGKDSQQIRGALRMLGQDDAERLLGLCQDADRQLRESRDTRSTTRTSSSSPSRCRASGSTSRRSSSSGRTASG